MKISSVNNVYNVNRNLKSKKIFFASNSNVQNKPDTVETTYSEQEIRKAKTKKVLSECRITVLAAIVFYFLLKNNFKANKQKSELKKMTEKAKLKAPDISEEFRQNKNFSKFFK